MTTPARMNDGGHAGFTLVELLVVIAILSLLASIILPALVSAKKSAHRIQCVSNLRQLGLASEMYWNEHEGRTFRFRGASTNGGDVFWFGWLERWTATNEEKRAYDASQSALYPYLQGRGVDACPSLRRDGDFKWKAAGATSGYGYNWHLSTPLNRLPLSMNEVKHPMETVLMADAAQINTFQLPATPDQPLLEEFYYLSAYEATAHFRHRNRANAVYCDGHVELARAAKGSWDERMPGKRVGRLPKEKLEL